MKRLWIALAIVVLLVGVSTAGLLHLLHATDELQTHLSAITDALEADEQDALIRLTDDFAAHWQKTEAVLLRFIHHEALDTITGVVARLPALARWHAYPELAAEVARLQELISHVREAEIPNLQNIF